MRRRYLIAPERARAQEHGESLAYVVTALALRLLRVVAVGLVGRGLMVGPCRALTLPAGWKQLLA